MNLSQTGINLIKSFEGCRLSAYKPTPAEPHYTIGYGHSGDDVRAGETITQAQADAYLAQDLSKFASGVLALIKVPVNQNQFDALVSFAYNCGLGSFKSSTLLTFVNQKNFSSAANEFAKWNKSGGKVLAGLIKRRAAEKALFLKAVPQPVKSVQKPIAKPIAKTVTKPAVKVVVSNTNIGIKSVGKIEIVEAKHAVYIVDRPSVTGDNLTTIDRGTEIDIAGSIPGWWEVIYHGKRAYVKSEYGKKI
jgi:GH24 family phage-related lysozyme (muramidase)